MFHKTATLFACLLFRDTEISRFVKTLVWKCEVSRSFSILLLFHERFRIPLFRETFRDMF
jgi:hypothetical protein